jgi:hypothetical protein
MNRRSVDGTVIIYCLALSALAVVVGYGFLRATIKDLESGDGGHQYQLAQESARAGTAHALECIIADFTAANLAIGRDAGGSQMLADPPTFLDGPFRAPFVAFTAPNQVGGDFNATDASDDLQAENLIISDLMPKTGSYTGAAQSRFHALGAQVDPSRGRFHEVNWTNLSRGAPTGALPTPVTPVRFSDTATGVPERNGACFLNRTFTRLASGDAQSDRLRARYRLRYSVSSEDLEGHLLANPFPDLDDDWRGAPGYRAIPGRYANFQHGWYNIVAAFGGLDPTTPLRAEHVFLGRGNASNADRAASGYPISFPMMFRSPDGAIDRPWWGYYSRNTVARDPAETDRLFEGCSPAGGEALPADRGSVWSLFATGDRPLMHSWTGPQYSWINLHSATRGYYAGWLDDGSNSATGGSLWENATLPTIVGRRLQAAGGSGPWPWQSGRVDTPWRVNLLTAPPRAIHCILVAYLPPAVKVLKLTREQYFKHGGVDADGRAIYTAMGPPVSFAPASIDVSLRGRDLFTSLAGPAFADYPPPSGPAPGGGPAITPNFQIPDPRASGQRYPGRLWNDNDDFGKDIGTDTLIPVGRCSHTAQTFLYDVSTRLSAYAGANPSLRTPRPATWGGAGGPLDRVEWTIDPAVYKFADSYWWDLLHAMTSAIAIVRAQWVQYPSEIITPSTAFTPAAFRDPAQFRSIESLDRLFLRQLGESFTSPGDGVPAPGVELRWDDNARNMRFIDGGVTVSTTIRGVATGISADAAERARSMERVLNDMRLSFFGADPTYSGTFRPLDFDGDGRVQCSGYPAVAGASASEIEDGIQHWLPLDAAHAQPGRGPAPNEWFSLSGCFTIGKSRFFRVQVRGEVFDNLIRVPVADATLESVVALDTDDDGDLRDTRILFQRWHHNPVNSHLPRHQD